MHIEHIEGVVFAIAALLTALEMPRRLRSFSRWMSRRLKPLVGYPRVLRTVFYITVAFSLMIIPIHTVAFILEAKAHLSA